MSGRDVSLWALTLVLALGCAFGGLLVQQEHRDRELAAAEQERYGDVLASARREVEAFINIRYDDAQASIDRVAAGATGALAEQYGTRTKEALRKLRSAKSVMEGEVLWAGVVDIGEDSATVIAATSGTVANVSTGNEPVDRYFRLRLDLVHEDGTWLTEHLEFVD